MLLVWGSSNLIYINADFTRKISQEREIIICTIRPVLLVGP